MKGIDEDPNLDLQIIATGTHLSREFGNTFTEIENDGFRIDLKIPILSDLDSTVGVSESISNAVKGSAVAFAETKPDLILILGDRFEIFAFAISAMIASIPIAHVHGGEVTTGSIDDAMRHAITKISHLHFVSTDEYRKRVIQLGESEDRVFNVGGLGVDAIKNTKLLNQKEIEKLLGFKFLKKNLIFSYHPVTLQSDLGMTELRNVLQSLSELTETRIICTLSNADLGGREINSKISEFVSASDNAVSFVSMGSLRYLSCMALVDGVIGNSSSGILEAPSFKIGTINIGQRQNGRIMADSVINCDGSKSAVSASLSQLYSNEFAKKVKTVLSPYGNGGACEQIIEIVKSTDLTGLIQKKFVDIC